MTDEEHFYRCGWSPALAAAREAVAALDPLCSGLCECLPDALAAIDALRLPAKR